MAQHIEFRIEEHSRRLFGINHFAVYRVGKLKRDNSRTLRRIGWYASREEAQRVVEAQQAD